jgi:cytochrome c553
MNRQTALTFMGVIVGLSISPAAAEGDIKRGESKAAMCIACHGPGGNSQMPDVYPGIAGRDAGYLEQALREYQDGVRTDPQMAPMAAQLSDEDIRDLAAYFSAQQAE